MFNYADFETNPKKYEMFRTARVKSQVFTENGEDDLAAGQFVAIHHIRNAYNGVRRRAEPVYSVTTAGRVWGVMFANNLSDFCL